MLSIEQINKLQEENERLKSQFQIESLRDNRTGETFYRSMKLCKYKTCLQEIKAIAEENHFYFVEGAIVSYKTIKQLATNFDKILDLITKAESEG